MQNKTVMNVHPGFDGVAFIVIIATVNWLQTFVQTKGFSIFVLVYSHILIFTATFGLHSKLDTQGELIRS